MQVIKLRNLFTNGFDPNKDLKEAEAILIEFQAVYDAIDAKTACIRYIDGDRKGSIARVSFSDKYRPQARPEITYNPYSGSWNKSLTKMIAGDHFYCTATWDGRRNKVQASFPNREIEVLLNYDGPTVWALFDAKAAKAEVLKNPDQKDINGEVLAVGDEVLYINARYGSRMTLEKGTVLEFAVTANSKSHTVATIIGSKTGEQSSLQYPESMVCKMQAIEKERVWIPADPAAWDD